MSKTTEGEPDYIARAAKRTGQDPDRLRAYVEREVAKAPPLTDEQRHEIARLLTPRLVDVLPAPDEATARRIIATLNKPGPTLSEPLHVDIEVER